MCVCIAYSFLVGGPLFNPFICFYYFSPERPTIQYHYFYYTKRVYTRSVYYARVYITVVVCVRRATEFHGNRRNDLILPGIRLISFSRYVR